MSALNNSSLAFDNAGTVEALTGTLRFDGGGTHTAGVFTAAAGAEVFFNIGTHTGTLEGTPAGVVRLDVSATLADATIDFGGTGFEWQSGTFSTVTNAGLLRLTTAGTKDLNGNSTLTNTSRVEMTDTGFLRFLGGNSQFVNASGATFDLQSDADFTFFNGGNTFTNSGLFQKTGGAGVSQISSSAIAFTNAAGGVVSAESGTLDVDGVFTHAAGALVQGTATFDRAGATLTHDGDTGPGTSPGALAWTGAWAPEATSSLFVEIGGNGGAGAPDGHDQLQVSGGATLAGTLDLSIFGSPTFSVNDSFTILTAASVTGTFAAVAEPTGIGFDVAYNADNVVVTINRIDATNNDPVIASLTGDQVGDAGDTFAFTASATDPDAGDALTYAYDFGDGSPVASGVDLTSTSHVYATAGTYTLTLTVDDGNGGTDTATLEITVDEPDPVNTPPTILSLSGDTSGEEGDLFNFTAAAVDLDGDALTYAYDFGDGSPGASGVDLTEVSHVYDTAGTYTLTLTVTDGKGGTDTETLEITVDEPDPVNTPPTITSLTGDQTGDAGETFDFMAAATDPDAGRRLTYAYDFGDGSPVASGVDLTSTSHVYDDGRDVHAHPHRHDGSGGADTASLMVTVDEPTGDARRDDRPRDGHADAPRRGRRRGVLRHAHERRGHRADASTSG